MKIYELKCMIEAHKLPRDRYNLFVPGLASRIFKASYFTSPKLIL